MQFNHLDSLLIRPLVRTLFRVARECIYDRVERQHEVVFVNYFEYPESVSCFLNKCVQITLKTDKDMNENYSEMLRPISILPIENSRIPPALAKCRSPFTEDTSE